MRSVLIPCSPVMFLIWASMPPWGIDYPYIEARMITEPMASTVGSGQGRSRHSLLGLLPMLNELQLGWRSNFYRWVRRFILCGEEIETLAC